MIAVMLFLTAAAFATIGYLFHFATNGPPDDRFATASELSIGFVTGMAHGLIGAFSLVCAILFTYASLVEAHQAALLVNTWDKLKQIEGEAA